MIHRRHYHCGGQINSTTSEELSIPDELSPTTDENIEIVELPEINTVIDTQRICDSETGKCGVRNKIYESHTIDGM